MVQNRTKLLANKGLSIIRITLYAKQNIRDGRKANVYDS